MRDAAPRRGSSARYGAAKGVECAAMLRSRPDARLFDLQRPPMREDGPKSRIGGLWPNYPSSGADEGALPHTQSPVTRTASQRDPGAGNELRCMGSIRRAIRVTIYHHRTDLRLCGLVELDSGVSLKTDRRNNEAGRRP